MVRAAFSDVLGFSTPLLQDLAIYLVHETQRNMLGRLAVAGTWDFTLSSEPALESCTFPKM